MSAGTWREDLYAEKEEVGNFGNFFREKRGLGRGRN